MRPGPTGSIQARAGAQVTLLLTLALALTLTVAPVRLAAAHTDMTSSDPASGSTVEGPVSTVEMVFAAAVNPNSAETVVLVEGTEVTATILPEPGDDARLVIEMSPIDQGRVEVVLSVLALDGHRITVDIAFVVTPTTVTSQAVTSQPVTSQPVTSRTGRPPVSAEVSTTSREAATATELLAQRESSGATVALPLVRLPAYVFLLVMIGWVTLAGLARAGGRPGVLGSRSARLGRLAAIGTIGAAVGWWVVQALVNSPARPPGWTTAGLAAMTVGALVVWASIHRASSADEVALPIIRAVATVVAALGLVVAGHARTSGSPVMATVSLAAHLLAAGGWVGGLAVLVGSGADRAELVSRYSKAAGYLLGLVVVSGVARTSVEASAAGGITSLPQTTYGRLLAVKVAVFTIITVIGAVNRFTSVPRVKAGDRVGFDRLRRLGGAELTLALIVLALTTALVQEG